VALTHVKIYGERNSGTNFASELIEANLDVGLRPGTVPARRKYFYWPLRRLLGRKLGTKFVERSIDRYHRRHFAENLGWKHAQIPTFDGPDNPFPSTTLYVTVTKNPYAWLLSLYRRPYGLQDLPIDPGTLTFREFLQVPWRTFGRELGPAFYPNAIAMWNEKTKSYRKLSGYGPVVHGRYEAILADPAAFVEAVARRCGRKLPAKIRLIEHSTKKDGWNLNDYREYYLQELWRNKLTPDELALINRTLDPEVVVAAGYKMIRPEDLNF